LLQSGDQFENNSSIVVQNQGANNDNLFKSGSKLHKEKSNIINARSRMS